MMDKVYTKLELQLKQTYKEVLRGYSETVSTRIKNYFFALDAIDPSIFISDTTDEEKLSYLIKLNELKHPDFYQIYFIDTKGKALLLDGSKIDVTDRDYYRATAIYDNYNYISDALNSRNTDKPIVMLTRALIDENGDYRGIISASIMLSRIQSIFSSMDVGQKDDFILHDSKGLILAHSDPSLLFKIYKPADEKFSFYSTDTIAKMKEGVVKTIDAKTKETIFELFEPVKNSSWVVGIKIPEKVFTSMNETQIFYEQLALIISSVAIFLLLILEVRVIDIFQKKKLITSIYDNLTGLWTRQMFEAEATKLLRRHSKSKFMLIECDIRGFKFINQNYGERIADNVVIYYTQLLKKATDEMHGLIGRAFADHVYILFEITTVRNAMNIFKQKLLEINDEIKHYEIPFFPKFGVAFLLTKEETRETSIQALIGNATFAKSTIKENVLDQYAIYNSHLLKKVINERYIESHMESALENEEFFVMYQPKINLKTDEIVGAEALVRWNSAKLGIVTPDNFIPLFERNGFITKLDFYVYDKVFKFIRNRLDEGGDIVPISVNMSRNHNKPDKFVHDFMESFNKYNIPTNLVQVEILERSIMDRNTLQEITRLLHKEGFTVAMDDFGSGESSLNMLTKIPVDVLKFDKTFLQPVETTDDKDIDTKTANFIESLIKLGKNLEKETLFEGVETEEQRDFLRKIGCDQVQGYFYSKPLREKDFIEYINNNISKV